MCCINESFVLYGVSEGSLLRAVIPRPYKPPTTGRNRHVYIRYMKSIDDLADFPFRKFGSAEGSNSIFTIFFYTLFSHVLFGKMAFQSS